MEALCDITTVEQTNEVGGAFILNISGAFKDMWLLHNARPVICRLITSISLLRYTTSLVCHCSKFVVGLSWKFPSPSISPHAVFFH